MESINPATGEVIWQGVACDAAAVDEAVAAARKAFPAWARLSFAERLAIIERFRDLVENNKAKLAETISQETGKTLWDASSEVAAVIGKVAISVKAYHERTGEKFIDMQAGIKAHLLHKPHGVLAVFGPYNFPAHLPNGHIVPALLAGNTIVFKPSNLTPLVAERMFALWQQAGLPDGVINLTQGKREAGVALAAHRDIDGLLFTGSTTTGCSLHKQYGGQPHKIMALEMGGNNPLIIWEPEDLQAAAYHTILSAFISTGQRCTCARRLIVPDNAEGKKLLDILVDMAGNIVVGAYTDSPEPFMGPLIRNAEAEEVLQAQEDKLSAGASALLPMKRLDADKPFVTAGIIDVTELANLEDREFFAPFLQVIRVQEFADAIACANNTEFGLASAIFTRHKKLYEQFLLESRAGLVNWNRQTTGASSALPFGGTGISGNHRPAGYYSADYCAYPVSSLESEELLIPKNISPGLSL